MSRVWSVRDEWKMACPKCGVDEAIHICAEVYVQLSVAGTEPVDGGYDWDKDSRAVCTACHFGGCVSDFYLGEEAHNE
jgi:hypothetical protein